MELDITKKRKTIIDSEDYDKVKDYKWHLLKTGYVATSVGGRKNKKMIYIHRLITNCPDGKVVDHINGNPLDNRKKNLRICLHIENCLNRKKSSINTKTSKYKGVHFDKNRNKWRTSIRVNGTNFYLGRFNSEIEAKNAYDNFAINCKFGKINEK